MSEEPSDLEQLTTTLTNVSLASVLLQTIGSCLTDIYDFFPTMRLSQRLGTTVGPAVVEEEENIAQNIRKAIQNIQAQAWAEGYKAAAGAYNESNAEAEDFQEEAQEHNPYKTKETNE